MPNTGLHRLAELMAEQYQDPPRSNDRRVIFLQGRIAGLEVAIAELKSESERIADQRVQLHSNTRRSLLEDRLLSAVMHRQARIPVLIAHAECEIEQFRADLAKYYTRH